MVHGVGGKIWRNIPLGGHPHAPPLDHRVQTHPAGPPRQHASAPAGRAPRPDHAAPAVRSVAASTGSRQGFYRAADPAAAGAGATWWRRRLSSCSSSCSASSRRAGCHSCFFPWSKAMWSAPNSRCRRACRSKRPPPPSRRIEAAGQELAETLPDAGRRSDHPPHACHRRALSHSVTSPWQFGGGDRRPSRRSDARVVPGRRTHGQGQGTRGPMAGTDRPDSRGRRAELPHQQRPLGASRSSCS